ncbi:MAG: MBL fold metallo-hydrolase, partial [Candidatus Thiodiazotropha sp.]
FAVGESRDLEVGSGMVTLRTLAGDEYELEAIIGAETAAGSEGLEVELLPAGDGTSLLIQAGDPSSPVRILVDCGRRGAGRLLEERLGQLEPDSSYLDLMVLTHIDDDRIGGALALLENDKLELEIRDIWFNGYRHLAAPQEREL